MKSPTPSTDSLDLVRAIATNLRSAMEVADFSDCAINLNRFPSDCCSHASSLLLILFHESSIDDFRLMRGTKPEWGEAAHEWVQRDSVVVDITADQFEGLNLPSVMVGDSAWHRSLSGIAQRESIEYDIECYKLASYAYERIMATEYFDGYRARS